MSKEELKKCHCHEEESSCSCDECNCEDEKCSCNNECNCGSDDGCNCGCDDGCNCGCDDGCNCGCEDVHVTEAELRERVNILVDDYSTSEIYNEMLLEKGRKASVEGKFEEAVNLYTQAAVLGNGTAIANLAHCYLNGKGVKKDVTIAKNYYELASKLGVANAMYKLGDLYMEGIGVDVNKERAVCLYQLAFDTAFFAKDPWSMPDAALRLAKEKLHGDVIEQDVEDAEFLLTVAQGMFADRMEFDPASEEYYNECTDLLSRIIEED